MRVLGLDHGSRRVGVAITDWLGITAQGVGTMDGKDEEKLLRDIQELVIERDVERIVVGLPINMDGSEGPQALTVRHFVERLEGHMPKIPVELFDERLTSVEADRILDEVGIRGPDRKKHRDRIAAQVLLQDWLEVGRT